MVVVIPQTMQNDPWRWEKVETSVDRWETNVKSCEAEQSVLGDKLETSVKSCGHRTQSVVGDKCEIMRTTASRVTNGRQARNHAGRECSVVGDNWETSAKSCGPKHSEHPECTEGQAGDKPETTPAENSECSGRLGQVEDKSEIMRTESTLQWGTAGRQVRDKCEIMRTKALTASRV